VSGGLWTAVALTLLTSALLPFAVRPLLYRFAVVDVPSERSSHVRPTLRGGGIAPGMGIVLGTLVLAAAIPGVTGRLLVVTAVASAAFATLGFIDDVRSLSSLSRAVVQIVIATAVCAAIVTVTDGPWWLYVLGPVAVAGYVNVANFMDGINTVSGLHGTVVGASFVVSGALADQPWLMGLGACIAVAFLAFVPWNVLGRRMFLGDVGSYLLGGTIAVAAVAAFAVGVPLIAVVAPLVPYLVDTSSTLIRRVARGERWFEAHNTHVYQELARRHGHLPASSIVTAATVACAAAGSLAFTGQGGAVAAVVVFAVVAAVYLSLPSWTLRLTHREARVEHV
jgi:UDP-N-acetylmuramyl pentapeptide phosphotransferase/UDP-N-acetylglucosamine-1-phosphate transferase